MYSAAEHLALEHLDPVDMTFHDVGVSGEGEARDDGVEVAFEVSGEVSEAGQIGRGGGRFSSGRQLVALEVSNHVTDVVWSRQPARAAGPRLPGTGAVEVLPGSDLRERAPMTAG